MTGATCAAWTQRSASYSGRHAEFKRTTRETSDGSLRCEEWRVRPNPLPKAFGRTLNCGPGAWAIECVGCSYPSLRREGGKIFSLTLAPIRPLLRPADPFTPLTRKQAADDVEFYGLDETPEELRRQSIEWAIDRLENPEDYPALGEAELTDADRELLDETFGVTPTTAVDPDTWGGNDGE